MSRILSLVPKVNPELGSVQAALDRAWPIESLPSSFDDLLKAIDEADRDRGGPSADPG